MIPNLLLLRLVVSEFIYGGFLVRTIMKIGIESEGAVGVQSMGKAAVAGALEAGLLVCISARMKTLLTN
jgi:hypothetical protein